MNAITTKCNTEECATMIFRINSEIVLKRLPASEVFSPSLPGISGLHFLGAQRLPASEVFSLALFAQIALKQTVLNAFRHQRSFHSR